MSTRPATQDEEQWIDAVHFCERRTKRARQTCNDAAKALKNHCAKTEGLEQTMAYAANELNSARTTLAQTRDRLLDEIKREALRED